MDLSKAASTGRSMDRKTKVALGCCAVRLAHDELIATLVLPQGVVEVRSDHIFVRLGRAGPAGGVVYGEQWKSPVQAQESAITNRIDPDIKCYLSFELVIMLLSLFMVNNKHCAWFVLPVQSGQYRCARGFC